MIFSSSGTSPTSRNNWFARVRKLGITKNTPVSLVRGIKMSNWINFFTLAQLIPVSLLFLWAGIPKLAIVSILATVGFLLIFFLHQKQMHHIARSLQILMLTGVVAVFSLYFGTDSALHYLYIGIATIPFLIFHIREVVGIAVSVAISGLMFFTVRYMAGPESDALTPGQIQVIQTLVWGFMFVWLPVLFWHFAHIGYNKGKQLKHYAHSLENEIQQRKKMEAQLSRSLVSMENQKKELERFNYITSHDLQDPIRTIQTFTDHIQDHYFDELDGDLQKCLGFINEAAQRMSQLIEALMIYSQIGTSKSTVPVSCHELVAEILDQLSDDLEQHKITVEYDRLPEIEGNRQELIMIFTNLIHNAIKYRKPGKAQHIAIRAIEIPDAYRFEVEDRGIGIEPELKDRIFQPFQRLHNRFEYDGLGISLAHCKKAVEARGGSIGVESRLGEGSKFYFTLLKSAILNEQREAKMRITG